LNYYFNIALKIKIKESYKKNRHDFFGLILKKYPKFVFSNDNCILEKIPIFVCHNNRFHDFEEKLLYIRNNGYKTLSADEFLATCKGKKNDFQNKVVITADDGHISLYREIFPILKKYKAKIISFICPGLVDNADLRRSNFKNRELCNWSEIQEMHNSGLVDIQSHSLYHHTIFTSPKIIDFVSPEKDYSIASDHIYPVLGDLKHPLFPDNMPLGAPIYESHPRYGKYDRFKGDKRLFDECVRFVNINGGKEYFKKKDWKKNLFSIARRVLKEKQKRYIYETKTERYRQIMQDLSLSKQLIKKKLNDKIDVRHLALPEFIGSRAVIEAAREVGYAAIYWGGYIPNYTKNHKRLINFQRINSIYIFRLPGEKRRTLTKILRKKLRI